MKLRNIFKELDDWIDGQNREAYEDGLATIPKCEFRVLGQTALLEAKLNLDVAATVDVDAFTNANYQVVSKFSDLLKINFLEYDRLSNEIWMPEETEYNEIFFGTWVNAFCASPMHVLLSKAKKAPVKNKVLIQQYIASNPPEIFFDLCKKYQVTL